MRVALLAATLFAMASPIRAQDLVVPTAMASTGETIYLAYPDNSVWWAHGQLAEIPAANRGVGISTMCPDPSGAIVVYTDNQAWLVHTPNSATFLFDMTRAQDPGRHVVRVSTGSGLVAAYDDGQIWAHDGHVLRRVEMWERLDPASEVEESAPATSIRVMPNPCAGQTTIALALPDPGTATIGVFDVAGRLVRDFGASGLTAGTHSVLWDGRDDAGRGVASGLYFARVATRQGTEASPVVLSR